MSNDQKARRTSSGRIILYALAGILVFFALKSFQNRDQRFVGTVPQEFPADGSWLGTNQPLRLADLRGKVVLMQFSFINCPYCREMDPHLHKWHSELSSHGLVIVEIDDGNADSFDELRNWAASAGITYPVYYDAGGRMCANYGIESFPTLLLIGRDGKVVWEVFGWGGDAGIAKLENEIRAALKLQAGT
jgi:thiol-disulfide isomerase/thioredoxin